MPCSLDQAKRQLLDSIRDRRADHERPFPYHVVTDPVAAPLREDLRALPAASRAMTGARSDGNDSRFYFNPSVRAAHRPADMLARVFQDRDVVAALAAASGALLKSAYLLMELACDCGVSELHPHRDLGVKRFTGLFYLSDDPKLADARTDLYTPKPDRAARISAAVAQGRDPDRADFEQATARPPHGARFGYFFTPSDVSWHGFDRRPLNGLRQTIIVNYLGPAASGETYRNVQNLAFPDEPISL
ncbi:MAG: hypothetical protein BGP06_13205 [Rhizobiales bacterium 65-9]|nr:hypothetical protein [Hyphomicrobiales bacterium]OJY34080.1 MAG: hypothetical protein BGP06_13205 [Rhizobiales bacterium 65-9]